jgi:hypothetical protein
MSTHREGTERWQGNQREDGLSVVQGTDGWIIMTCEGGAAMDICPCCDKPFLSDRAARKVADLVYPVARRDG